MKLNRRQRRDFMVAMGFLAPNFIGFLIFTTGPLLFSLMVSFSNWNLQRTIPFGWIFTENYRELLGESEFWICFINTAYLMLGMPLAIAGSLFLAVLLSQNLRGMVVYRTIFYLPSITSGVALMILWKVLYNPDFGPINAAIDWALHTLHINDALQLVSGVTVAAPKWLLSTNNLLGLDVERVGLAAKQWGLGARDAIIIMGIWIAIGGNNMLLYLAALANVPHELYEAAHIDGAGRWAAFRHITWPQIAPTTFFIVVMSFIGGLQGGFEQARIMTKGGPAGTTTTLSYHIYIKAFEEMRMGYASAISWILFIMIFAVTLLNWRFGNKDLND
ncbi:MAG: sugar ABC transporter permease [Candidatus Sumerlaeota bacterium]|nr:sugar ABC transporter permease [Candidatus Sumerlaeota bacterium]